MGSVLTVNVGQPRQIGMRRGRPWMSAIGKRPAGGRLGLDPAAHLIDGDAQVAAVHGGADKAVYAYATEDTAWWQGELGRELWPGAFGENLTTSGIDCTEAVIGERWRIGSAVLEVCQPRLPCATLGKFHERPSLVKEFAQARRPGAYLRIVDPGDGIAAGDPIEIVDRPAHGITTALVSAAMLEDRQLASRALEAPQLAASLAAQLRERAGAG